MTGTNGKGGNGSLLESAMTQAMEAEQRAAKAVAASRQQAEEILMNARHMAAEIEARTERRMAAVQKGRAKILKKRLESIKLQQHRSAAFLAQNREELTALTDAVTQLALQLIGGGSSDHPARR